MAIFLKRWRLVWPVLTVVLLAGNARAAATNSAANPIGVTNHPARYKRSSSVVTRVMSPPVINKISPPTLVKENSGAAISVTAGGSGPLSYQWTFEHGTLGTATNPYVLFKNITETNAGFYTAVVSNAVGTARATTSLRTMRPGFDLNGDGQPDLLLRNEDGQMAAWLMDHGTVAKSVALNNGQPINPGWRVVSSGNLTGQGASDVLLAGTNNNFVCVHFDGTNQCAITPLEKPADMDASWRVSTLPEFMTMAAGPDAKIVAVADLNGDKEPDLVVVDAKGIVSVVLLRNAKAASRIELFDGKSLSDGWQIVGPR